MKTTREVNHEKTKTTRQQYEGQPVTKLRRLIKNQDPEYLEARKKYAEKEQTKNRRKELNKRRRLLCATFIRLAGQKLLTTVNGEEISVLSNYLVIPSRKVAVFCKKDGQVIEKPYQNEVDLLSREMFAEEEISPPDQEYLNLLRRFLEDDPEVEELIKKKKKINPPKPIDLEKVKQNIKNKKDRIFQREHITHMTMSVTDDNVGEEESISESD